MQSRHLNHPCPGSHSKKAGSPYDFGIGGTRGTGATGGVGSTCDGGGTNGNAMASAAVAVAAKFAVAMVVSIFP